MKRVCLLLFLSLVWNWKAASQDFRTYHNDQNLAEREHQVDVTHLKLNVSFVPKKGEVHGVVTHTFVPLRSKVDTLFLNAPQINILRVKLNGKSVPFTVNTKGVILRFKKSLVWEQSYDLEIKYVAKPKKGLYFIGWNSPDHKDKRNMTRRQLWTQGQGIDNRHWIPMYDDMNDKFTTEMIVEFDSSYKVLSNGDLVSSQKDATGKKIWHYKLGKPHPGYLIMLAIDEFAVKRTKTKNGTPVQFWYYPEHPEKLEPTSRYTEQIIEFYESETGVSYPWGAYSQVMVQDFMYGAMENTSATIFGDFFFVDTRAFLDRNYINVNAHELAHQWFGDLVTARSSADAWLQESFATYYAKLFIREYAGEDELKWSQLNEVKTALNASKANDLPVRHSRSGSSRIYQKGSSVLQMLSYVMGREHFNKSINLYLNRHAFKNVETADLQKAIIDATGMNMHWFFEQWIHKGGEPHYKVSWTETKTGTRISVNQIHKQNATIGLFKMPIQFAVYYKDGTVDLKKAWVESEHEYIDFKNPKGKEVAFVVFDENSEITKRITFNRPGRELAAQLVKARYMSDRYEALVAMRKLPLSEKESWLKEVFGLENFWGIRAELARQLASSKDLELLKRISSDKHAGVRKALVQSLKVLPNNIGIFINALSDSSYVTVETAFRKIMESNATLEDKTKAMDICSIEEGHSHSIKIAWLEHAYTFYKEDLWQYKNVLISYSSNSYEFRTRIAALKALYKLDIFTEDVIRNLLDASVSKNRRLMQPSRKIYKDFISRTANKKAVADHFKKGKYNQEQLKVFMNSRLYVE
jgi:aminopeptidase N